MIEEGERCNVELRVTNEFGTTAANVHRYLVPRDELAGMAALAARMVAELLGEQPPAAAPATKERALVTGESVTVRLGMSTVSGDPVTREGQAVFDLSAPNGRTVVRLVPAFTQYELEALGHAFEWAQRAERERTAGIAPPGRENTMLSALTRAAGLPDPVTPNQWTETERALKMMIRLGRASGEARAASDSDGDDARRALAGIREVLDRVAVNAIAVVSPGAAGKLAKIAELAGMRISRDDDGRPLVIAMPDAEDGGTSA